MTFVITKTSDSTPYIKTFDTIQDIIDFAKKVDEELIIKGNFWYNHESISSCAKCCSISEKLASEIVTIANEIEIYDDYRE